MEVLSSADWLGDRERYSAFQSMWTGTNWMPENKTLANLSIQILNLIKMVEDLLIECACLIAVNVWNNLNLKVRLSVAWEQEKVIWNIDKRRFMLYRDCIFTAWQGKVTVTVTYIAVFKCFKSSYCAWFMLLLLSSGDCILTLCHVKCDIKIYLLLSDL